MEFVKVMPYFHHKFYNSLHESSKLKKTPNAKVVGKLHQQHNHFGQTTHVPPKMNEHAI